LTLRSCEECTPLLQDLLFTPLWQRVICSYKSTPAVYDYDIGSIIEYRRNGAQDPSCDESSIKLSTSLGR